MFTIIIHNLIIKLIFLLNLSLGLNYITIDFITINGINKRFNDNGKTNNKYK